jgi:putative transposase
MTVKQGTTSVIDVKALLEGDGDYLRAMVRAVVEATLEAEMTAALGAEKGERSEGRLGYRSGYYSRTLVTRVGTLELRVPQDRDGLFSTRLFERYQRSEKALVAALAEMYVQGVSTRKVKAITKELCGHGFSASTISDINKTIGCRARRLHGARAGGDGLPLPDPRRAVREGARGGRDPLAGGAGRDRRRLGGPEQRAGGGAGQPGERHELEGLPRRAEGAWRAAARGRLAAAATFLRNALDHLPRRAGDDCPAGSSGGSTTGATSPRHARTSPAGSRSGRRSTRSSATGSRRPSRRPSPTSACRSSTTST